MDRLNHTREEIAFQLMIALVSGAGVNGNNEAHYRALAPRAFVLADYFIKERDRT